MNDDDDAAEIHIILLITHFLLFILFVIILLDDFSFVSFIRFIILHGEKCTTTYNDVILFELSLIFLIKYLNVQANVRKTCCSD